MPALNQTSDRTRSGDYSYGPRLIDSFRVLPNVTYPVGACLQLVSIDQQVAPDICTVGLPPTTANPQLIMGVVSDAWNGFDNAGSFTSPAANARGTADVDVVLEGYHPAGLIDQAGTSAVSITNGVALIPSRRTSGYMQGVTTAVAGYGTVGIAVLPASGLCSSLTAAALAQGSNTVTVAGTPATNDVLTVNVQIPYNTTAPGIAQVRTVSTTLTSAQAASVTTAAAALVVALNADPVFAAYYIATSAAGVVTITVAPGALFTITYATTWSGYTVTGGQMTFTWTGSACNGATITSSAVGGSTLTAAGNIAAGTGYFGSIPLMVV
ncbi:MAG: hypothetical protein ACREML_09860 [Vulcanimicrobiaceae bacterium]